MSKKARDDIPGDDGRVIAPMNVEGMPWHVPKDVHSASNENMSAPVMITRREQAAFTWGVLKAALLAALVFIGGLLAFILFCTELWFR